MDIDYGKVLRNLEIEDIKLLSQITQNAGLRNHELTEKAEISKEFKPYQLSRKIKHLRDTFVKNYR